MQGAFSIRRSRMQWPYLHIMPVQEEGQQSGPMRAKMPKEGVVHYDGPEQARVMSLIRSASAEHQVEYGLSVTQHVQQAQDTLDPGP